MRGSQVDGNSAVIDHQIASFPIHDLSADRANHNPSAILTGGAVLTMPVICTCIVAAAVGPVADAPRPMLGVQCSTLSSERPVNRRGAKDQISRPEHTP